MIEVGHAHVYCKCVSASGTEVHLLYVAMY